MKEFNVLHWDFNSDSLTYYNVLPYFRECIAKDKPTDIQSLKSCIEGASRYRFWARCEYEMICHGWPVRKNDHKLDIHEQVMMNIDVITDILWEEINK